MNSYVFFENAIQVFVMAYLTSVLLLIAAAKIGLAVIETLEEVKD